MKNSDKTTFPASESDHSNNTKGLTKREYFAAMAMQGFLANPYTVESVFKLHSETGIDTSTQIAGMAIEVADEILKQL